MRDGNRARAVAEHQQPLALFRCVLAGGVGEGPRHEFDRGGARQRGTTRALDIEASPGPHRGIGQEGSSRGAGRLPIQARCDAEPEDAEQKAPAPSIGSDVRERVVAEVRGHVLGRARLSCTKTQGAIIW